MLNTPTGFFLAEAGSDAEGEGSIFPDDMPTSLTVSETFVIQMMADTAYSVTKQASADGGGVEEGTYEAQAILDPVFTIDPTFMVDFNGVPTLATELYEIQYSPGVTPIVPEPVTLGVLCFAWSACSRRSR